MARSLDLNVILKTPDELRDEEWERVLFQSLIDSPLTLLNDQAKIGPDGWPYLFVSSDPSGDERGENVVEWLAPRGIGLALNPQKEVPDYVFTYGMIWNFKERGEFLTSMSQMVYDGKVHFDEGTQVLAGPPTEQFLPKYVRSVLFDFFNQQGIKSPRILVISKDQKHYDLCFSLESMGNPANTEHPGIAEALAWFLPQHYSLMLVSEKGLPPFHDLT